MRITLLLLATSLLMAQSNVDGPQFTSDGRLMMPSDYRQWVFLSSGLGMTYGPAALGNRANPMFDNVFVNPAAYKSFLETGRWPDKTMFILEIRRSTGKGSINNGGHYQTSVQAIEAAVKDESRFPQKWAYFGFDGKDTAKAHPATSSCNSCHGKDAAVENTFVQFYPTLLEVATKKNTLNRAYIEKSAREK